MLLRQQPEEAVNKMETDSFAVKNGKEVVVADIRILPIDKQDSVWVQIATEDYTFWLDSRVSSVKTSRPSRPDFAVYLYVLKHSLTHFFDCYLNHGCRLFGTQDIEEERTHRTL